MRKYSICLYLFLAVSFACMVIGYAAVRYERKEEKLSHSMEETLSSEENAANEREAANQEQVVPDVLEEEQYCLMSENGFLLVYSRDRDDVCLYTHMPLLDFPQEEQDRLREGIWFSSMMEVFQYLESFTS